jgi:hypothetical protein
MFQRLQTAIFMAPSKFDIFLTRQAIGAKSVHLSIEIYLVGGTGSWYSSTGAVISPRVTTFEYEEARRVTRGGCYESTCSGDRGFIRSRLVGGIKIREESLRTRCLVIQSCTDCCGCDCVPARLRRSSRQPWHAKIGTSPLQPPPFTIASHHIHIVTQGLSNALRKVHSRPI